MEKEIVPSYVEKILLKITEILDPVSIFLYGSMARDDFESDSDYEIGVVYKNASKMSRSELKEINPNSNIKIYPFIYEDLIVGKIDTPFPKYFYLRNIAESSINIFGKNIKDIVKVPKLKKKDLFEQFGYCSGRAYSAVVSSKQNDLIAVRDGFTKSMLYGLQMLVFVKTGRIIFSYKELADKSLKFVPDEFKELVNIVFEVRKRNIIFDFSYLYKSISFLNKVVLKEIDRIDF